MKLITPETISFRAAISEADLRERIADEVLEQIGALDQDSKPLPGVKVTVRRGDGRKGGYTVDVTGPAPARVRMLTAPEA